MREKRKRNVLLAEEGPLWGWVINGVAATMFLGIVAIIVEPDLIPGFVPKKDLDYVVDGWRIIGRDKLGHFFLTGMGALLLNILLKAKKVNWLGFSFLLGSAIMVVLVSLEELRQVPLPDRNFELFDLFYNFAGILLLGWLGAWLIQRREQHFSKRGET